MTRDAFWSVPAPAPTDRALRLPEEKVFRELTGRRRQPVLRVVSPQGIGLVAQGRCRLPGLERHHWRGLAPRAMASNARMSRRDVFWPVQPPLPTDQVLRFPEEKVFLELMGRRYQPVRGLVSPQGTGLVAQGHCRGLPGPERPHRHGLAPRVMAANPRMTRDVFWPVQLPVAPTDRAQCLPEEEVFLEPAGRHC